MDYEIPEAILVIIETIIVILWYKEIIIKNPEVLSIAYKCSKGSIWDLCCNHNTVAQQTLFIDALLYPIELTQFILHTIHIHWPLPVIVTPHAQCKQG